MRVTVAATSAASRGGTAVSATATVTRVPAIAQSQARTGLDVTAAGHSVTGAAHSGAAHSVTATVVSRAVRHVVRRRGPTPGAVGRPAGPEVSPAAVRAVPMALMSPALLVRTVRGRATDPSGPGGLRVRVAGPSAPAHPAVAVTAVRGRRTGPSGPGGSAPGRPAATGVDRGAATVRPAATRAVILAARPTTRARAAGRTAVTAAAVVRSPPAAQALAGAAPAGRVVSSAVPGPRPVPPLSGATPTDRRTPRWTRT